MLVNCFSQIAYPQIYDPKFGSPTDNLINERTSSRTTVTTSKCDFAVIFNDTSVLVDQARYQNVMNYLRENIELVDINDQHDDQEGGKRVVCVIVKNKERDSKNLQAHIQSKILKKRMFQSKRNDELLHCDEKQESWECTNAFEFTIRPGKETLVAKEESKKSQKIDKPPHVMCDIAITFASICCGIHQSQYESTMRLLRKKIKTQSLIDKRLGKEGERDICVVLKNSADKEKALEKLKKEIITQKSTDTNTPDAKITDCEATPETESCIIPTPNN